VVAPVWHCIELQAVGELHLFGLAKLLELLPSLLVPLGLLRCVFWGCVKLLKLKGLDRRSVTVPSQGVQGGGLRVVEGAYMAVFSEKTLRQAD
jgi:hypothetical protein